MTKEIELRSGFETAYIDGSVVSDASYRPQFVFNSYKEGKKVLSSIEDELLKCDQFQISVAFITDSGLAPLLQTLKELEKRGIKGQILTTNYLNFSEPKALLKLNGYKNITLKMYDVNNAKKGFHTKGYIFKKDDLYRIIIGSSNITKNALTTNEEWNTRIISTEQGEIAKKVIGEFEELWNSRYSLEFDDFYELYKEQYQIIKHQREIASKDSILSLEKYKLEPNSMQVEFINNLKNIINANQDRALLISATGTGKTYASAFAMRELGFKKVLFLVHREQILKQAKKSYENVLDKTEIKTGLLSGNHKDINADYLFSTVQTMSRDNILSKFEPNRFECVIIDETHKAGAGSYHKIINHFKPQLLLGMTASPERTDGFDIYKLFNHNIASEIRLSDALENNLLCPFHYFGLTDLTINGIDIDDSTEFRYLATNERVNHIIKEAEYYGHSGNRVKGLIFCSRNEEAKALSEAFNMRGYNTIALSGDNSQDEREEAIQRLEIDCHVDSLGRTIWNGNNSKTPLDYIFTVDIFNEGVDIPQINQVIMLRKTESAIIFIQQLGRGLRKSYDKEYVVVLDFIGNYDSNFLIPIALSGDRTYNKDNIRRYIMEGVRVIPGESTVHFDEISRKRIFDSIDKAKFNDISLIKKNYINLKNKLGRIPRLKEFDDYGEMDILRIFDNDRLGSYYKFLVKYESEYKVRLSNDEEKVIEFVSKKFANGKRIHELLLLKRILTFANNLSKYEMFSDLKQELLCNYGKELNIKQKQNIINIMTNKFATGSSRKTYDKCILIEKKEDKYCLSEMFLSMIKNKYFFDILNELVEFGISRNYRDYGKTYNDTELVLYQKYTYEDVCRLLNWEQSEVPLNIGGYKYDKKTKTLPVFINYHKDDSVSDTIKYEDHFTSSSSLVAISKSARNIQSDDVQNFLHAKERGIQVELFVRKNKDDKISKEFYYLGHMRASGKTKQFIMPNTTKTAVEIEWILDVPIREDLYQYIINS